MTNNRMSIKKKKWEGSQITYSTGYIFLIIIINFIIFR